jgi:hypothetical protein
MFQANSPRVVHETLDGETIIIDTQTGLYYTADGHTGAAWLALTAGVPPEVIGQAYAAAGHPLAAQVPALVQELLAAELIVPDTQTAAASYTVPGLPGDSLALKRHADMQELIELDPIHEVDPGQGWPMRMPAAG